MIGQAPARDEGTQQGTQRPPQAGTSKRHPASGQGWVMGAAAALAGLIVSASAVMIGIGLVVAAANAALH